MIKVLKEFSYDSCLKWCNYDMIEIGWVGLGEFVCDNIVLWKILIKKNNDVEFDKNCKN